MKTDEKLSNTVRTRPRRIKILVRFAIRSRRSNQCLARGRATLQVCRVVTIRADCIGRKALRCVLRKHDKYDKCDQCVRFRIAFVVPFRDGRTCGIRKRDEYELATSLTNATVVYLYGHAEIL